jgi:Protein of unknown function (DUF3352)
VTDPIPPSSGSPEPVSASEHTPSPWAAPSADATYPTYPPTVSDMTVTGASPSTMSTQSLPTQPSTAAGETFVEFGAGDRPAPRRGRRRAIVLSASTALLLLIGVGAYAGVRAWTGGGAEPESAMPASVSAFARIDLNPGYGNKLTINGLVKKFPTHGSSTTDLVTELETRIAKEAGLDYTTDVKPWFGGRAGVGAWVDGQGKPVALIALSSKDDAKAESTLAKLRQTKGSDSFGFAMEKGYALIAGSDGDMQAQASAAAAAAQKATLADNARFKSTIAHVGGDNLLVAYADLGQVARLAKSALGSSTLDGLDGAGADGTGGPLGILGMPGLGAAGGSSALSGFVAVGGKVTGDGIEVRAHVDGMKATSASTPAKVFATLAVEPSATIVGAATTGIDPAGDTAKQLSNALGLLASGAALGSVGSSDDPFSGDPGTDPLGGDPGSDPGADPMGGAMTTVITDVVTPILTAKQLSVAFTGLGTDKTPGVIVNVQERDAATASSLTDSINQLVGGAAPPGLFKVKQNGASVSATIGAPVIGGSLGSSDLFTKTMAGMSDANAAGYVDIQKVMALAGRDMSAADRQTWAPVKSVGFGATYGRTSSDVLLRVVIK